MSGVSRGWHVSNYKDGENKNNMMVKCIEKQIAFYRGR